MTEITPINPPFSIDALAERIRESSNFRFEYQFFRFDRLDPDNPDAIMSVANLIASTPAYHRFLRDSFVSMYGEAFSCHCIHHHCRFQPAKGEFQRILATAANDNLGAYSRDLRDAPPSDCQKVDDLFSTLGEFLVYELVPGRVDGCSICEEHNSHLFTGWFYRVAWDWCYVLAWPERKILWLGCLTDTD